MKDYPPLAHVPLRPEQRPAGELVIVTSAWMAVNEAQRQFLWDGINARDREIARLEAELLEARSTARRPEAA